MGLCQEELWKDRQPRTVGADVHNGRLVSSTRGVEPHCTHPDAR